MMVHKTFRVKCDLFFIIGLSLLLAGLIALDSRWLAIRFGASIPGQVAMAVGKGAGTHWLRVMLGLLLALFFPGYALMAAIFPGRGELNVIERLAFSFGLSIVIVPLIGYGLNFTPWGIRLVPILVSLIAIVVLFSLLVLWRRRQLPAEEIYMPGFDYSLPIFRELPRSDRVLSVLLILAILSTIGSIVYFRAFPPVERFSEFYVLGANGKLGDYPTKLMVDRPAQATAVVVSHEQTVVTYTMQTWVGKAIYATTGPFALSNGQKWTCPVKFTAQTPGTKIEVQFLLFRQGDVTPYRSLHIWVSAVAPPVS
jgi:uncharacterized membrane protein